MMKIKNIFFIYLILILFFFTESGCGAKSELPPPILTKKQLQEAIIQRFEKGETTAHNYEVLLSALPPLISPFDSANDKGSRLNISGISFSEASRNYYYSDDYSLIVNLSDYATDSTAFMHLFHRFESVQKDSFPQSADTLHVHGGFAWMWDQNVSDHSVHHFEAGIETRYHIHIKTNHPEGQQLLTEVFEAINWEKLRKK